jgi:ParB family chromosome partitioning protein
MAERSKARVISTDGRRPRQGSRNAQDANSKDSIILIDPSRIEPNPRNPRQSFSDHDIDALAESLNADGQLQAILVRRVGERFQLIAGERRWRAAQRAHLSAVEAKVRDVDDREAVRLSIIENFHRVDLSPTETIAALDDLTEMAGQMGLRAAARLLNTAPSWLSERLRVRSDPVVYPALEAGKLSLGQATELRRAPAAVRPSLLDRFLQERPTTEVIRGWIREIKAADLRRRTSAAARRERPYNVLVDQLREMGVPTSVREQEALQRLGRLVQELLATGPKSSERTRRPQAVAPGRRSPGRSRSSGRRAPSTGIY